MVRVDRQSGELRARRGSGGGGLVLIPCAKHSAAPRASVERASARHIGASRRRAWSASVDLCASQFSGVSLDGADPFRALA